MKEEMVDKLMDAAEEELKDAAKAQIGTPQLEINEETQEINIGGDIDGDGTIDKTFFKIKITNSIFWKVVVPVAMGAAILLWAYNTIG